MHTLLRIMVHYPEWRARVLAQIGDLSGIPDHERELVTLLGATPEAVASVEILGVVEGGARALLAELLDDKWVGLNIDRSVEAETNALRARAIAAEREYIAHRLPLATGDEKATLMIRARELGETNLRLKPGVWNVIRKGES
jgi:hypothetical protein